MYRNQRRREVSGREYWAGEGHFARIYYKKLISVCQNFYDHP